MHRYMISYIDQNSLGTANGNVEMRLPEPIRHMDDVNWITHSLREHHHLNQPIVMGFSAFAEGDQ